MENGQWHEFAEEVTYLEYLEVEYLDIWFIHKYRKISNTTSRLYYYQSVRESMGYTLGGGLSK